MRHDHILILSRLQVIGAYHKIIKRCVGNDKREWGQIDDFSKGQPGFGVYGRPPSAILYMTKTRFRAQKAGFGTPDPLSPGSAPGLVRLKCVLDTSTKFGREEDITTLCLLNLIAPLPPSKFYFSII